ncbi:unnamed protein product [Vicia faba]|uniref:Uncharacterized protein n=1 Tax=Vicia faba TaxID=3906 RepID=A0AAV1B1Z7_VICFA|nr:unnamed protein product [Vicia faba]
MPSSTGCKGNGYRSKGVYHIPYSELMERKAKGLCFRWGEKFLPLHQCAGKQLRLVISSDDEICNNKGEVLAIEAKEGDEGMECNSMMLFGLEGEAEITILSLIPYIWRSMAGKSMENQCSRASFEDKIDSEGGNDRTPWPNGIDGLIICPTLTASRRLS